MTGSTAPRGTDVLVIGAGAIGAAISWYCTLLGLSVRVVDRGAPGGGTSSRCEGNILVSDKERGPELDLARYSLGLWHGELAEHGRRWELERKGGIIVASRESSLASLRRALAAQREHGIEVQELDAAELASLEPYASPEAVGAALYPDDSQVMPMLVVAHLRARCACCGTTTASARTPRIMCPRSAPTHGPPGCGTRAATRAPGSG